MPAYVLAYAYTDALQFSGPLQTALRGCTRRCRARCGPTCAACRGAVVLFVLCLYPYVYLLTRAALAERAVPTDGGRAPARRRHCGAACCEVALPLARPALAAGVALALMETLADYGVGAYFGLTTFTTGIYKAWLVMNDRIAAAQLAIAAAGWSWRCCCGSSGARSAGCAFASRAGAPHGGEARPSRCAAGRPGGLARCARCRCCSASCCRCVAGAHAVAARRLASELGLPLARFAAMGAGPAFSLAATAPRPATLLALALAPGAARRAGSPASPLRAGGARGVARLRGARRGDRGRHPAAAGLAAGALARQRRWRAGVTGTALGLMYAYLVRFSAVALQSVEAGYARVPAVDRRQRAHARRRRAARLLRTARAAVAALGAGRRRCWCSST